MKTINEIRSILEAHGLSEYTAEIEAAVKDSIHIELSAAREEDIPLGASKAGGLPDLPDGAEWFRHKNENVPLSFVCQINFAETAPYDRAHNLPDRGILYFFYDASAQPWGFDPGDGDGKVLYYYDGDLSGLKRTSAPDDLKESGGLFAPSAMRFGHAIDLPDPESAAGEKLPLDEDGADMYYELLYSIPGPGNKLLGHSSNIQGDMETECELVSQKIYCGDPGGYAEGRARGLDKNADRWSLLLQLDSNEKSGMMWGDCGRLYVWIADEDLKAKRFDAGWVILQCY